MIDTALKECIHLLLTVIYDHTKYRNVYLQMCIHSPFPHFTAYPFGEESLLEKEIVFMNTNTHCI